MIELFLCIDYSWMIKCLAFKRIHGIPCYILLAKAGNNFKHCLISMFFVKSLQCILALCSLGMDHAYGSRNLLVIQGKVSIKIILSDLLSKPCIIQNDHSNRSREWKTMQHLSANQISHRFSLSQWKTSPQRVSGQSGSNQGSRTGKYLLMNHVWKCCMNSTFILENGQMTINLTNLIYISSDDWY